jgi:uncharacterized membrane protein
MTWTGTISLLRTAASIGLTLAYPAVVFVGLTRFSTRVVGLSVIVLWGALAIVRPPGSSAWSAAIRPLLPVLVLAAAAAAIDDPRALKAVPVAINAVLLVVFARSLRADDVPLVERFARAIDPDLTAPKRAYCRQVTRVWIAFFALNAIVTAWLAVGAPTLWWATYTGAIAYGLMGVLFAVELLVRRVKFGPEAVRFPRHRSTHPTGTGAGTPSDRSPP